MRYLNSYRLFESSLQSEEIISNIKDILLEINDSGIYTNVEPHTSSYLCYIGNGEKSFEFRDFSEPFKRLLDFSADENYFLDEISFETRDSERVSVGQRGTRQSYSRSITKIRTQPNSVFDNRHPEKVINDISNNRLSSYYSDDNFTSPIGIEWGLNNKVWKVSLNFNYR